MFIILARSKQRPVFYGPEDSIRAFRKADDSSGEEVHQASIAKLEPNVFNYSTVY
jgi:hypothetical protein